MFFIKLIWWIRTRTSFLKFDLKNASNFAVYTIKFIWFDKFAPNYVTYCILLSRIVTEPNFNSVPGVEIKTYGGAYPIPHTYPIPSLKLSEKKQLTNFQKHSNCEKLLQCVFIGTTCFDKLFLFHVTTGRQWLL